MLGGVQSRRQATGKALSEGEDLPCGDLFLPLRFEAAVRLSPVSRESSVARAWAFGFFRFRLREFYSLIAEYHPCLVWARQLSQKSADFTSTLSTPWLEAITQRQS